EAGLLETCAQALAHFEVLGCSVEHLTLDFDLERLWRAWIDLRSFCVSGANAALYADPHTRSQLKPEAVWEIERGLRLSGPQVYEALKVRSAWYQHLRDLFEKVDFLVLPAT